MGVPVCACVCVFGMEAVALYTFRATEGDELSFNKGDMLKVRSDSESFTGESDETLW